MLDKAQLLQAQLNQNPIHYAPWPGVIGPLNFGTSNQITYELLNSIGEPVPNMIIKNGGSFGGYQFDTGIAPGLNAGPQGLPGQGAPTGSLLGIFQGLY